MFQRDQRLRWRHRAIVATRRRGHGFRQSRIAEKALPFRLIADLNQDLLSKDPAGVGAICSTGAAATRVQADAFARRAWRQSPRPAMLRRSQSRDTRIGPPVGPGAFAGRSAGPTWVKALRPDLTPCPSRVTPAPANHVASTPSRSRGARCGCRASHAVTGRPNRSGRKHKLRQFVSRGPSGVLQDGCRAIGSGRDRIAARPRAGRNLSAADPVRRPRFAHSCHAALLPDLPVSSIAPL